MVKCWHITVGDINQIVDASNIHRLIRLNLQVELAAHQLNYFCNHELTKALNLAESLAASYEARTRLLRGINHDNNHLSCDQLW